MGVGVSLTAFGSSLASLSWRGTRPGRHHAITFLSALILTIILPGCASVDVHMLSSQTFTPQTSTVEVLERAPTRPYVQIAFLTVNSGLMSEDSRREKIVEKASELGADAVVFGALRPSAPAQVIARQNRALHRLCHRPQIPRRSCRMICSHLWKRAYSMAKSVFTSYVEAVAEGAAMHMAATGEVDRGLLD